jgi:hypothetical protein
LEWDWVLEFGIWGEGEEQFHLVSIRVYPVLWLHKMVIMGSVHKTGWMKGNVK